MLRYGDNNGSFCDDNVTPSSCFVMIEDRGSSERDDNAVL